MFNMTEICLLQDFFRRNQKLLLWFKFLLVRVSVTYRKTPGHCYRTIEVGQSAASFGLWSWSEGNIPDLWRLDRGQHPKSIEAGQRAASLEHQEKKGSRCKILSVGERAQGSPPPLGVGVGLGL